jgi:hypothetical protein
MLFPGLRNGLFGAHWPAADPPRFLLIAERLLENRTVAVSCHSWFEQYQFKNCDFLWVGISAGSNAEIFVSCRFDDCNFAMPVAEFLAFTRDSVINVLRRRTKQEALDEAARRYCQHDRALAGRCLDPSYSAERQEIMDWVLAEYRKILDEMSPDIEVTDLKPRLCSLSADGAAVHTTLQGALPRPAEAGWRTA